MYKEVIARNRIISIALIIFCVVTALYIEQGIDFTIYEKKHIKTPFDYILMGLTSIFVAYELFTFKIKYKYSYIANKLIVNRKIFNSEKNLISVRNDDIVYIGKCKHMPKDIKAKLIGKYTFDFNSTICVFSSGGKYYKFKFSPSEKLITKLKIGM